MQRIYNIFVGFVIIVLGIILIVVEKRIGGGLFVMSLSILAFWKNPSLDFFQTKCPNCNNKESKITEKLNVIKSYKIADVKRIDEHYDSQNKYSGATVRNEQANVTVYNYDEVTKCQHCDYVYSSENITISGTLPA